MHQNPLHVYDYEINQAKINVAYYQKYLVLHSLMDFYIKKKNKINIHFIDY